MNDVSEWSTVGLLALSVACASWTVTREELFREVQDWARKIHAQRVRLWVVRKAVCPLFCGYCLSHPVAALAVWLTDFRMLAPGAVGFVLAVLAVVWMANVLMLLTEWLLA